MNSNLNSTMAKSFVVLSWSVFIPSSNSGFDSPFSILISLFCLGSVPKKKNNKSWDPNEDCVYVGNGIMKLILYRCFYKLHLTKHPHKTQTKQIYKRSKKKKPTHTKNFVIRHFK